MPGGPQRLIIAGRRGWRYEPIYATRDELALHEAVTIADDLDDDDLMALYTLADVVAQVSLTEGFGLPVLEAMHCGVPVVASTGGALPEITGDAALPVAPEDEDGIAAALHQATTDEELRQHLIRKGYERVAHFTWRATAEATLRLYRQITS